MNSCVKHLQSCSFMKNLYIIIKKKITSILAYENPYRKIYMYEVDDQLNKLDFLSCNQYPDYHLYRREFSF